MKKLLSSLAALSLIPTILVCLSLIGLPIAAMGFLHPEEKAPEKVEKVIPVVDFRKTPAASVISATFKELERDKRFKANSTEVSSAGFPHPFSCVTPTAPLSQSKGYKVRGDDAQVTIAAYPAGLGHEVFERLMKKVTECKPSTTYMTTADSDGVGVEGGFASVAWSENRVEVTLFRRGDLIAFVATDANKDSKGKAKIVDGVLERRLSKEVCPDPKGTEDAVTRNAFYAAKDFTGKREVYRLTTEPLELPTLTPELQAEGVKAVEIPGENYNIERVERPSDDFAYPLWPPLPKEPKFPKYPEAPKPQKLKSKTWVRVEDPIGPGCGWAFLTTVEPTYDAERIEAQNAARIDAAQAKLDADGPRWQADVISYWVAYQNYLDRIEAYEAYALKVKRVAKAWDKIHEAWRDYYTAYENWRLRDNARKAFIAQKKAAKQGYRDQIARCEYVSERLPEAQGELDGQKAKQKSLGSRITTLKARIAELKAKRDASVDDGDPETPVGPPLTSAEAQELKDKQEELATVRDSKKAVDKRVRSLDAEVRGLLEEQANDCPARKPSILGQKAPKKEPEPKKPADPRPPEARD